MCIRDRYIHVLHVGFDNQVHEGELVVNKDIADDVLEIFKELYESCLLYTSRCV